MADTLTYGATEINRLCEIFKMPQCLNLVGDWSNLSIPIIDIEMIFAHLNPVHLKRT